MKKYLFSYGTLQRKKVQRELFGRILRGSPDSLNGYKTSSVEIKDTSFLSKGEETYQQTLIISNETDIITGTALEVTSTELQLADKYEPDNYKRIKVKLQSGKDAWVYVADNALVN